MTGGTIELVLLSVNLRTELAELLDKEEVVWGPFDVTSPADELGVGFGATATSPELELLAEVIVANDELLSVFVSDFVVAEPVNVTPAPVTCTSGFDEVALVPGDSKLGFAERVAEGLLEGPESVDLVEGAWETSWELDVPEGELEAEEANRID